MKLSINKDVCLGCGMCVQMAPDIFKIGAEKIAVVLQQPDAMTDEIQTAIEFCPGAIETE